MSWWLRRPENRTAVAPSLLAADFRDIRSDIAGFEAAGADLLHLDVMDGHFVPNLTFGPFICEAIRDCTGMVLDAHLMITHPDRYLEPFARAGMDAVTIHVEAVSPVAATLARIRELGMRPGITLNPDTPVAALAPHLDAVDLVLVMTVPPGFGGQAFDPEGPARIDELRRQREERGLGFAISVDGGVNAETAPACRAAGADILVSGSYLCRAGDRAATVDRLRGGGASLR